MHEQNRPRRPHRVRAPFTAIALLAALPLLWLSGCGSDTEPSDGQFHTVSGEAVPFHPAAAGPTRFGEIPWPSDLYLQGDHVGAVPGLERIASLPAKILQGLTALDGFGRSTGALFFVDSDVDPDSLPRTWDAANSPDASVLLVDVDPSSPQRGKHYPVYARFLPTLQCISVIPVPGIVLPPGVRHAAVLTTRVKTTGGVPLVAASSLSRIATLPLHERISAAERLYGDAFDVLAATRAVHRKDDVAALAVFTTSRKAFEMVELRSRLHKLPEPELILDPALASPYSVAVFGAEGQPSLDDWLGEPVRDENGNEWPGGDNPGGIAHDQIGTIASGAFTAPSFLDRSTHHIERTAEGDFALADADATIPVTLVLPKAPPPPEGYPVIIHGHGLSNHRGSMFGVINELARAGFAVIGIDDVLHGARQPIKDLQNNFAGPYRGPDGIPDGVGFPVSFFSGFSDFVAIRDHFRQTVVDQMSLVRLIRSSHLDLSALARSARDPVPRLDGNRIVWSGGSLGGIIGSMTLAVEPDIRAAALQVPGAGFIQFITTNSAQLAPLVFSLARLTLGLEGDEEIDEFHPVAAILAAITEAGDPLSYAPHIMRDPLLPDRLPPDLLITYAVQDEVLPNLSTVALIRATGTALASPRLFDLPGIPTIDSPVSANAPNGRTAAAVQYFPANHGLGYSRYDTRQFYPDLPREGIDRFPRLPAEIRFEQPLREHISQLVTFLGGATAGAAHIPITAPPRQDYDGDGILDEIEVANGTNPYDPQQ